MLACLVLLPACFTGSTDGTKLSATPGIKEIRVASRPYTLELADWQIGNVLRPVDYSMIRQSGIDGLVLREQISHELAENGLDTAFPVFFRLEKPPYLLVVSPRSRIEYFDRILLKQDLGSEQIEFVEKSIDAYGYSSLVVELGGLGAAYPAIVSPDLSVGQLINAIVEEWAHQYLALKPLGFLYLMDSLGIRQDQDVITLNETLAGMISDEIGGKVYERYYKAADKSEAKPISAGFNFVEEMRRTRVTVDDLLARGEIEEAEKYMEERRQVFLENGYKIRKLNQAYFAFHGIYGQDPGSVSPIYADLIKLRQSYGSLADFVKDISNLTTYEQFKTIVRNRLH